MRYPLDYEYKNYFIIEQVRNNNPTYRIEGKIRNSKRYLTRSYIKHFQNVSHRFKIQLTFPEFPETVFKHIKKIFV